VDNKTSCILMFTTHGKQLDMRDMSLYNYEHEYITYPNETFLVDNYYNLYDDYKKSIIKVYHCVNVGTDGFRPLYPRINTRMDNMLNNLSIVVNGIINNLKFDHYLIVSANFYQVVIPYLDESRRDYTIALYSDTIDYDESQGYLSVKHHSTSTAYHEFVMKTLQLLIGLNVPYTIMIIDTSYLQVQTHTPKQYNVTYINSHNTIVTKVGDYQMCLYALSYDINATMFFNYIHNIDHDHDQNQELETETQIELQQTLDVPVYLKHISGDNYVLTY